MQYDRISNRELVGVQNNLVCILDEGVERNAPTFVLENLAAVIAGGLGRVLLDVMPCAGAAVHHKSPPSLSPRFLALHDESRSLIQAHRVMMRRPMKHQTGDLPYFRKKVLGALRCTG
jgi:hypothetical protein